MANPGSFDGWITDRITFRTVAPKSGSTGTFDFWTTDRIAVYDIVFSNGAVGTSTNILTAINDFRRRRDAATYQANGLRWRREPVKDPAAETTAIANERTKVIVSRVASDAVLRRNLATIQANGLRQRREPVKDPAAEITAIANERTRVIVSRAASDAYLRRNLNTVQANGQAQLRQRWRKDPSAEIAPTTNGQITRPIGNQQASGRALAQRQSTVAQINALWARRNPLIELPTSARAEVIQRQVGLLATQRAKRAAIVSVYPALRLFRQAAWLAPYDTTPAVGTLPLTELARRWQFVEVGRGALTELPRSRAFTEPNL